MITSSAFGIPGGKFIKKAAKKTVSTAKKTAKVVAKPVAKVAAVAVAPMTVAAAMAAKAAFNLITRPLRSKVNTLKSQRALKLARDRRGPRAIPTNPEKVEAKNWTKAKLKSQGPHGLLLALLAGPPDMDMGYPGFGEFGALGVDPATTAAITASIPILTSVLNKLITKITGSGEIASLATTAAAAYAQQRASGVPTGTPVSSMFPRPQMPRPAPAPYTPPYEEQVESAEAADEGDAPMQAEEALEGYLGVAVSDNTRTAVLAGVGVALLGTGLFLALRTPSLT